MYAGTEMRDSSPQITVKTHNEPFLDDKSKQLIENIKKVTHKYGIRRQTEALANYWKDQYMLKQMIVDVKQVNYLSNRQVDRLKSQNSEGIQTTKKFQVNLYPDFHRIQQILQLKSKALNHGVYFNLLTSPFKQFMILQEWKYIKHQYSLEAMLATYNSYKFYVSQKYGKPIDKNWVTDCSKFLFVKPLKFSSLDQNSLFRYNFYFQLKGYQNRLGKNVKIQPGIYKSKELLKYQDVFQIGMTTRYNGDNPSAYFKINLGSSLYSQSYYYKLKYYEQRMFNLVPENLQLGIQTKFSFIDGVNLQMLPQELINRNEKKWLKERSTAVLNFRANLYAVGNRILSFFGIMPYNYLSFWAYDNFANKSKDAKSKYLKNVKFDGELGVGLKIGSNKLSLDYPLLRLQGNPYEPKLGIKLEF